MLRSRLWLYLQNSPVSVLFAVEGAQSAPSPKESASKFANLCKNELLNGLTSAYVDAADGLVKAF